MSNYYRAGDSYGRGGNYAYQAGGIFGSIGKFLGGAVKTVAKIGASVLPGPIGMAARALTNPGQRVSFFPPEPSLPNPFPLTMGGGGGYEQQPVGTMLRNEFIAGCQLKGTRPNKSGYYKQVTKGDPTNVVYIPAKSVCVKSRRLNVANPRALRRAIRRAQGFSKLARRVMTFVSAKAPKGRAKFKKAR